MAIRLSGLMSGMDTESIIQQLVSARKTKVDDAKKAQIKLSWQQDAWKGLNTKLKNLQNQISSLRFTTAYTKKTTRVSNSNAVSVITGENAVFGVQSMQIKQLAKTAYLTGAKVPGADGDVTAMSKLSDLGVNIGGTGTFTVKTGGRSVDIAVTNDSTISDVLNKLKDAGLNANFDAKNQRFFVSAKESGAANDFSITASDANGNAALQALGLQTSLADDPATLAEYGTYADYYVAGNRTATLDNMRSLINGTVQSRVDAYVNQYKSLASSKADAEKKLDELDDKYKDDPTWKDQNYDTLLESINQQIESKKEDMKNLSGTSDMLAAEEELVELQKQAAEYETLKADKEAYETQSANITQYNKQMGDIKDYVDITETTGNDGEIVYGGTETGKLVGEVENAYYDKADYAAKVISGEVNVSGGATKVVGQDAIVYLNDAEFTSTSNVFEINGLTFTALNTTAEGEQITVTTEQDTDGIYDMVKNFLKTYNEIINEMDKLYNADSAKGYEPLTSEEKDAMSDREIEEWEKKIKDAIFRKDGTVSNISTALKTVMSEGIEVNGKTMYLFNFGIEKLSYFEAADNEKNAYHIAGDPDDANTSGQDDMLKTMIAADPDTVVSFFTQLSRNLYGKMSELSSSIDGYRSFGNFFYDKKMKSDYDDYTTKIADLEKKLTDYEDQWYAKFASMETAMAKMQSNMSAVTALLGG